MELREETGVQRSLTERLVRNRLQWAGHVERMADDRLPKRAAELRERGRRRRGRPRLRWEDSVKRCEVLKQERRKTGRRRQETEEVEKTIKRGGEEVAGSTSPLTKGKRGRERFTELWFVNGNLLLKS